MRDYTRPSLSDKEVTNTDQLLVPPHAGLPAELDGVIEESDEDELSDESGEEDDAPIGAPRNLEVLGQVVHFASDNSQWVDVLFEYDAVPGARDYEMRITKL